MVRRLVLLRLPPLLLLLPLLLLPPRLLLPLVPMGGVIVEATPRRVCEREGVVTRYNSPKRSLKNC
jgi:hypothetical protein